MLKRTITDAPTSPVTAEVGNAEARNPRGAGSFALGLLVLLCLLPRPAHAALADDAKQPDAWFRSEAGQRVMTNVLSWQDAHGAWPKNQNSGAKFNSAGPAKLKGTFDNGATTTELAFLARAFQVTGDLRCQSALLKGLDGILEAQYPTGGWPQFYPPDPQYHRHITFNDGTMTRLLTLLRDVAQSPEFRWVDAARRQRAQAAFDRGIECILKCQVVVDGQPTVWCAQHDEVTYQPRSGRAYELVSLSGSESSGVLELLMSLERPSPEVVRAVEAGAAWFAAVRITGLRQTKVSGNKVMVADPTAPPLWARFYEIGTNRPFFCGRDGVKKYNLAEIEAERRNGYSWYGSWGERVARQYAQWQAKRKSRTP